MKRKISALICIMSMIYALTIPANACWAWGFEDVGELIHGKESQDAPGADIIITGTVVDIEAVFLARTSEHQSFSQPVTITSVQVTEVIKGNVSAGDIIKTTSTGHDPIYAVPDEEGNMVASSVDGPFLTMNQDYLLFLWESERDENIYRFGGANQGAFAVDGAGNITGGGHMGMASLGIVRELVLSQPIPAEPIIINEANPRTGVMFSAVTVFFAAGMMIIAKTALKRRIF